MIHRLLAIVALALCGACLTACDNFSADAQAVRDCWKKYQEACEAHDGKTATALLSAASIARYENIKKLALDAETNHVKVLSSWDQIEVFMMRAGLKRAELMKMDGAAYCTYAVEHGWWATEEDPEPLGSIKIRKDVATAVERDELGKWAIEFVREDGQWKLDEPSMDRFFEARIERVAAREHMATTDVLIFWVKENLGEVDQRTFWQPMR